MAMLQSLTSGHMIPVSLQCYKVYGHQDTKRVTWSGAKTLCASQGAGLAVLTDPVQQGTQSLSYYVYPHCALCYFM